MDLQTIGTRKEVRWIEAYETDTKNRTRKVNRRVVADNRQAIMNDEEAAWLLENHPDFEWHDHSQGGFATVVDGLRYRITKEQKAAHKVVVSPKKAKPRK